MEDSPEEQIRCKMHAIVSGAVHLQKYVAHQIKPTTAYQTKQILGKADLVNEQANAAYLLECQFRFGGLGKDPDSRAGKDQFPLFLHFFFSPAQNNSSQ